MITIVKETPHLFMWFSDGAKIPDGICPLPQNERFRYITRLKEECAKLFLTKTPVYLVYMGRLLSREQKILLENLQNEIPNLAVIDYDAVEQNISDETITGKVSTLADEYKKQERLNVGPGGIADLVDFTRLILLYNSKMLRNIAQEKINIALEWCEGLIYRDFDVTLEKETMPDIHTTHGYMATLNFLERVHKNYNYLIELANGNENLTQRITVFFKTYIYDIEKYKQILALFSKKNLSITDKINKKKFIEEYEGICVEKCDFEINFINSIFVENSFLAVSKDEHPLIDQIIKDVCKKGESPYAAVQEYFRKVFGRSRIELFNEYVIPQILGFNIGNDLTWKIGVTQQHQSEDSTTASPSQPQRNVDVNTPDMLAVSCESVRDTTLQNAKTSCEGNKNHQEIVNKLSILTKNYLRHLIKIKNNPMDNKYNIIIDLNNTLNDSSKSASEKLSGFQDKLQEAEKEILKNHREPNWVMFKKIALFFLGITAIGAIVGVIDYSIRRHHSIFCAPKSHGERFVLDIEEHVPPTGNNSKLIR